ncbi:MAG: tetratricopeptide repeat protein [Chlorobiaceae bacterium]|nr:tetratricopeptide repeat protein [Chlorobiaceae bacterium]NTV17771.1 tetratricopeptide repeat protein [Chlorobiaceae bacterium]
MNPSLPHSRLGRTCLFVFMLSAGLTMLTSCSSKQNEINNLQQQVWKNPQNANSYLLLGNAYARTKRYSEASTAYKRALAINPELDEALHALGAVAFNQKNYAEALKFFQKHLELSPKDSLRLYDLGNVSMQLGQFDKAAKLYSEAIENSDAFTDAHYNLAVCYIRTGRRAEAQAIYEWLLVKNNYLAVSLQKHLKKGTGE